MYGPYSWHCAFRGSNDDLHFAMAFDPGSFTYRGLTQDELRRNPLLNMKVVQWELRGARLNQLIWGETSQEETLAAADAAGPSSDDAPVAAAPAEAVEPAVSDHSAPRSGKRISPLQALDWTYNDSTISDTKIWKNTPQDQMQDPQIRFIRESFTAAKEDPETWSCQLRANVHVPRRCFALVHRLVSSTSGTGGHRGAAAMASRLWQHYFWEEMLTHCEQMCQHCKVCRNRDHVTSSSGAMA
eukprot:6212677-Pleurochrysis_carterae.AAC.1